MITVLTSEYKLTHLSPYIPTLLDSKYILVQHWTKITALGLPHSDIQNLPSAYSQRLQEAIYSTASLQITGCLGLGRPLFKSRPQSATDVYIKVFITEHLNVQKEVKIENLCIIFKILVPLENWNSMNQPGSHWGKVDFESPQSMIKVMQYPTDCLFIVEIGRIVYCSATVDKIANDQDCIDIFVDPTACAWSA